MGKMNLRTAILGALDCAGLKRILDEQNLGGVDRRGAYAMRAALRV